MTRSLSIAAVTVALTLVSGLVAGCALTSKGPTRDPRIFRPALETGSLPDSAAFTAPKPGGPALRIGRIKGSADLREDMAYRVSEVEVGFYEDRRWAERPEQYVRRALVRALFERDGLGQIVGGNGPTLDVEVIGFEEVRGAAPQARVVLEYALHDEWTVIIARTIVVEKPIAGAGGPVDPSAFVTAISAALREAVDRVAVDVGKGVRMAGPPPSGSGMTPVLVPVLVPVPVSTGAR